MNNKKISLGKRLKKRMKKELPFHIMLFPAVILVLLFKYIPLAGLSIAFQDYSPLSGLFHFQLFRVLYTIRCL